MSAPVIIVNFCQIWNREQTCSIKISATKVLPLLVGSEYSRLVFCSTAWVSVQYRNNPIALQLRHRWKTYSAFICNTSILPGWTDKRFASQTTHWHPCFAYIMQPLRCWGHKIHGCPLSRTFCKCIILHNYVHSQQNMVIFKMFPQSYIIIHLSHKLLCRVPNWNIYITDRSMGLKRKFYLMLSGAASPVT